MSTFNALYTIYKQDIETEDITFVKEARGRVYIDREEITIIEEFIDEEGVLHEDKVTVTLKCGRKICLLHDYDYMIVWKEGII